METSTHEEVPVVLVNNVPQAEEAARFVLGLSKGAYKKYERLEVVPAGTPILDSEDILELSKVELEEVYAKLAGVNPKIFPSKEMVLASVMIQIDRMSVAIPENDKDPAPDDAPRSAKAKKIRIPEIYVLLAPLTDESREALGKLPPQARECFSIMVELAASTDSLTFTEDVVKNAFVSCKERLATVQPPWRILQYYRGRLEAAGLMKVD